MKEKTKRRKGRREPDHIDGAKQFNDSGDLLSEGFVEKTERKEKGMSGFFGGNRKR